MKRTPLRDRRDATCMLCGFNHTRDCDIHHIVGGSRGRCDSWANLTLLCRKCHDSIQSAPHETPSVLRAKVYHDKPCTSWVRLTLLRGSWWPFDSLDP
jgi:5-methylcytosine-specific restriction endonuclease McrA